MTDNDPKINLTICWRWTCPTCKTENYEHGEEAKACEVMCEEHLEEIEDKEMMMVLQPTSILCKQCMAYFVVSDPDNDQEQEDYPPPPA